MEERKYKIVEEIYTNGWLKELCINMGVTDEDMDDLLQELVIILLQYNTEKLLGIFDRNELKFWVCKIIANQYHSKNSPYFKKYKKYYQLIDGNDINVDEEEFDGNGADEC